MACKPDSVPGLPPWMTIRLGAMLPPRLQLPTRASRVQASLRGYRARCRFRSRPREAPIRHCSGWGLPCRSCYQSRGGLLPHLFTVTVQARPSDLCGAFPGVAPAGRYPAPLPSWSPDFPRAPKGPRSSSHPRERLGRGEKGAGQCPPSCLPTGRRPAGTARDPSRRQSRRHRDQGPSGRARGRHSAGNPAARHPACCIWRSWSRSGTG